jgi:hypothetical protein
MPGEEQVSAERPDGRADWRMVVLVLLPAAVAYAILVWLYTPVPIIDDYWHIFSFAIDFEKAPTLAAKAALVMTTQVGPYKLILDHVIIGAELLLTGRISFLFLIVLGNLTPLALLWILWVNTPREKFEGRARMLVLLPVSLLLFSLNYAETLNWAISGIQQPMVILLSIAAIHFLVRAKDRAKDNSRDFAWACGFGLLASAAYANGMLVWPVGVVYLVLRGRRAWMQTVVWCAVFAASTVVYVWGYKPDGLVAHSSLWSKVLFLEMFCGGALENMHHRPVPYVSVVIGVAVLAVFLRAARTRYDKRNPFFFYSAVWLLLTGAVVANARIAMGMQLSLSSRYKIYCDLLLIFCYEYLLDRFARTVRARRVLQWSIAAALLVCVAGDFAGARFLLTRKGRAEAAMARYKAAPGSASPMFLVEDVLSPEEVQQEEKARVEMEEVRRLGVYRVP